MFYQKEVSQNTIMIRTGKVLDNSNAHEMTEMITAAQQAGHRNIILDMGDLNFISSAGVGSILGTVGTSREAGGDIVLCSMSDKILHVFEILDLCDYLTISADECTALEICAAGAGHK